MFLSYVFFVIIFIYMNYGILPEPESLFDLKKKFFF